MTVNVVPQEPCHARALELTYDEEDVLRDALGSTPADDATWEPSALNAVHSLRLKSSLGYSISRGVDEAAYAAVVAARIADFARHHRVALRFYWDWEALSYEIRVDSGVWQGETLWTLVRRVGSDLGVAVA